MHSWDRKPSTCKRCKRNTLIQNLELSSTDLNAIRRQSAPHTAMLSCSAEAIGLEPGFNSLMKNSLNVCPEHYSK
jgi:hypothetical protein